MSFHPLYQTPGVVKKWLCEECVARYGGAVVRPEWLDKKFALHVVGNFEWWGESDNLQRVTESLEVLVPGFDNNDEGALEREG